MEERTTIARPYAEAAYQQACQEEQVEVWATALELLSAIVQDDAVSVRLNHPRFSREQMSELVLEVGASVNNGTFSGTRENFVKVLLEAGRLGYAAEIYEQFHILKADAENTLDVEVVSAYPLSEVEVNEIAAAVKEKMGKEVEMTTSVDESLYGGIVVRAGDQVIDLSLKGRVSQLATLLHG